MRRARGLLRAVVDTNQFVSGSITRRGNPRKLLLAWRGAAFTLVISQEQRAEIAEVLSRPEICQKYDVSEREREALLRRIDRTAAEVNPRRRPAIPVRDAKDEKILALALAGRADYLVTGDEDLLVLRDDPRLGKLKVVTAREFLHILSEQPPN